ncbi:MAG: phytoene desaturase family protein [Parvularculaceae bacterium]
MTDTQTPKTEVGAAVSAIEGGVDAIVIGATIDGLAAAAYLGKAGLTTVLLEAGATPGGVVREREFAPGFRCVDGEHLIFALDPDLVAELDLYRFGLAYANRRLDTVYFFEDGPSLRLDGEPFRWKESVAKAGVEDTDAFGEIVDDLLQTANLMRTHLKLSAKPGARGGDALISQFFSGAPSDAAALVERFAIAPVDDVLDAALADERLKALLTAEASLRAAAAPYEAFSFLALAYGLTGEVAGLQGARAYPEGGAVAVADALRRAAQAAGVDFRASASVKSVIVEWDGVAGVELSGGAQIRAPVVVNALEARRAFIDHIGLGKLDIEFQQALAAPAQNIASARLHLALKGAPADRRTERNLMRRLVFAPSRAALRKAYHAARSGDAAAPLIIEAVFPGAFDKTAASANGQVISVIAHPVSFDPQPSQAARKSIEEAIVASLEVMAPEISTRIKAADLRLPVDLAADLDADPAAYAARPVILDQWARAQLLVQAGGVERYYFCGPEAQIGAGISGTTGRFAAKAAIEASRKRSGFL